MFKSRRDRSRKLSVRSIIAIGGAAVATLGVAQATGTMANPTDAVATTDSQVATGNFYPTPLTASVTCNGNGAGVVWDRRANISWAAVPEATGYYVELVRDNGDVRANWTRGANDRSVNGIAVTNPRGRYYVRVFTQNGPAQSSGYTASDKALQYKSASTDRTECESGSPGTSKPNAAWENTHDWTPGPVAPNGTNAFQRIPGMGMPLSELDAVESDEAITQIPSTSETPAPTTSTPPTSSTEAPTTSETPSTTPTTPPATSTNPPATTTPETTPTEEPKPELSDTIENGDLTAGWMKGGNKVAVVDADGNELASGRAEKGSKLHWLNGQLWIVGDSEVYRIMESPQDGTWKYYKDSGQNMPDFG